LPWWSERLWGLIDDIPPAASVVDVAAEAERLLRERTGRLLA
jgi:hypothetical protein